MGDILLVNPLIQNIKRIYDDAWVVMLTPPSMVDIAKYQYGVDDVVVWDRHGQHHGWKKMFEFIWNFPYKNIFAAFPIYSGDRAIILAWLLRAKYILGIKKNVLKLLLKSKYKIEADIFKGTQGFIVNHLSGITKEELFNYPMKLSLPDANKDAINVTKDLGEYIALCPTSSKISKDMKLEDMCYIIENLPYKIVLLGKGDSSKQLSEILAQKNYDNLIDLTNKTSYLELASIINCSKACISVDTGTLHLACALNKQTVGIFYDKQYFGYKPDSAIYPNAYCNYDMTPQDIIKRLFELMNN